MKARKSYLLINTRNGYICVRQNFDSINKAVEAGRNGMGFAWRVYDMETNRLVRQGFCK